MQYYNAWVSLLGTLLCIAVMFLISWWTALITFVVVITLYLYVSYRKPGNGYKSVCHFSALYSLSTIYFFSDVNWGSSTQAQCYSIALRSVLDLNGMEEHVKNYRPQILILSGLPGWRPPLVHFANLITKGLSLLVCGHVVLGNHSQREHESLTRKGNRWLNTQKIKGFFNIASELDLESGCRSLMQSVGMGKLRPNMLLMGYKSDWAKCDRTELLQYFNIIQ